jgi:hypothetical protein
MQRAIAPAICLLVASIALSGCATTRHLFSPLYDQVVLTRHPEPAYEALYPQYAEVCALTQFRRLDGVEGGAPGHAVMYLKGVCRDPDAPYPRIKSCDEAVVDPMDPGHGVGISVNKIFKNINWMATPGKRLFLDGDVEPSDRLTREHYDAVLEEAVEMGMMRGIEIHDSYLEEKDPSQSLEDFIAEQSIGTDFALRFARTIYCSRLPLTAEQMILVMDYLNRLNEEYALGEADYNWSGYSDNCVHTLHNALAAAFIWKPKSIRTIKLRQFFNLAIPSNEVVDLGALSSLTEFEDPRKVYENELWRKTLLQYDWLPMRHGALMSSIPIHQDNDLFDTRLRIFVLSRPFGYGTNKKANLMLRDGRGTELEQNLRWYRRLYEDILAARTGGTKTRSRDPGYREFEKRYYIYIESHLADVNQRLMLLQEERARSRAARSTLH